jgi:acylphosphatase
MKRRVYANYQGRVHGVGFRFTCQRIAGDTGVTGWVRNLSDGSVELMVEGREESLREFLTRIKDSMCRYISSDRIEWLAFQGEFKGFDVRF